MRYILVLFVLVPLGELYLLLAVSRVIGFWPTVALTLFTGVAGGYLAKREGLRVWRSVNQALARMEVPSTGLLEAALVLAGGIFLITPGVVTDVLGFLALIPTTRRLLARGLRTVVRRRLGTSRIEPPFRDIPVTPDARRNIPGEPRSVVDTTGESRD